jgi:hypothetical protein
MSGANTIHPRRFRRGLSVIQLVGCFAAIVAGVAVGAAFLQIDLKAAWQLGLARLGVAAPQENPAPADPSKEAATSGTNPTGDSQGGSSGVDTAMAEATQAYWGLLREIIQAEQAARASGEVNAQGDPRAMLYTRLEAFRQASDAIRKLSTKSVDAEAAGLADDLAAWYERAAELSEEGTLLDEADLASESGPQGRRWHSAQKQLREQLDLLTRKTTSLQGKLSARYRKTFADLR